MAKYLRSFENPFGVMTESGMTMEEVFLEQAEEEKRISGKNNWIPIEEIPDKGLDPLDILLALEEGEFLLMVDEKTGPRPEGWLEKLLRKHPEYSETPEPFFKEDADPPNDFFFPSSIGLRQEAKARINKQKVFGKGGKRERLRL